MTVLQEIQPAGTQPPVPTSGIYYYVSAQTITETPFQAKNQEQTQNNNLEDSKNKLLKPLDASQIPVENQDDVLLPIHIPDTHHLQACTDPLNREKQPHSESTDLGKNSLSLEDQTTLGNENESSSGFANVADQAGDGHLPQLFSSLKNLIQSKGPNVIKTQDTRATELNQDLGNSRNPKDPQAPLATKPRLNTLREGKRLQKTNVKAQKADGSVKKECPSPSQTALPPPGKLKFVPLPFLTEERSPVCRVPRRRRSPASDQPALVSSTQPGSTNAAQSTAVDSSQQVPAFLTYPACSSLGPVLTNSTQADLTKSTQPSVSQSAASRPVPYRTLPCTSLQQEPIPTAVPQNKPLPKPKSPYVNQEVYYFIPRPWRISEILGPEVSEPVTEEQRPEREAMKRQAQQERENAAKYTSLGKIQFFIEREKEMEIADSYGYIIIGKCRVLFIWELVSVEGPITEVARMDDKQGPETATAEPHQVSTMGADDQHGASLCNDYTREGPRFTNVSSGTLKDL
ncbi:hypothetical protein MUG91_G1651n1 [Manis pentadactyla]|nr:hypothetical protein MUG91_G1651n1 [Manis pentadactyla]